MHGGSYKDPGLATVREASPGANKPRVQGDFPLSGCAISLDTSRFGARSIQIVIRGFDNVRTTEGPAGGGPFTFL